MSSWRPWRLALCLSAALLVGCDSTTEAPTTSSEAKVPAEAPSPVAAAVSLKTVSCAEWDRALQQQQGHIVVVDTWATWCVPCREEFPQLVGLNSKFAPQGVVSMSVSVDEPDQQADALAFLEQHRAEFANFLIQDKNDAWFDKWNIKGIPVVLVFNPDGTLARKFDKDDPDNQFTYEDVEQFVVQLLGNNSASGG